MTNTESKNQTAWPLIVAIVSWIAILAGSFYSYAPLKARSESIAANEFSAARAMKTLEFLIGDSIPHPAGSPQNAVVRERIVSLLESYGLEVEIQSADNSSLKNPRYIKRSARLNNIIAIRRGIQSRIGSEQRHAIMLASHYDSVPAGPGASDDGVGTAALIEIAKMLSLEPPPNRDIVFLISDGEELGLNGATLFVEQHSLAKEIEIAINLEARGTTGPSMMFETSRNSGALVSLFSKTSPRPFASSLFYEIYRLMPNDTDFTVFKAAGMEGYNFAFVGNPVYYHTPQDNFENADAGSLQHHGENALGLIRGLMNPQTQEQLSEGRKPQPAEAVYFDLFGRWIVSWPWSWSIWICLASVIPLGVVVTRNGSAATIRSVAMHVLILAAIATATFGFGFLLQLTVRWDDRLAHPWPQFPFPLMAGFWFACLAVVAAICLAADKRLNSQSAWIANTIAWTTLAMAASVWVNGASYLFVVPVAISSSLGCLAIAFTKRDSQNTMAFIAAVTAISVGVIWLPTERMFYDGVGFKMPLLMLFRIAAVTSTLPCVLAMASRRSKFRFAILMSVTAVLLLVAAIFMNRA